MGRAEIHTSLSLDLYSKVATSLQLYGLMDSIFKLTIGPSQFTKQLEHSKLQKMPLLCDIHRWARRSGNKQMKTFPEEKLKSYKTNDGMS
ncbi:hypothetical protein WN943_021642 [Citrus x changshan-huyou]